MERKIAAILRAVLVTLTPILARSRVACLCLGLANAALGQELPSAAIKDHTANKVATFQANVVPVLAKYCTGCHGAEKAKGGLNLAAFAEERGARAQRKVWERVHEYLDGGVMPPEGRPQPTREELERLNQWLASALKPEDCAKPFDPGRVTIRRLNRSEYNNTIRDLFGIDFHPADDFPSDDVGYGFDNIGDVLSMPPLLMEKYLAAAEAISEDAIILEPTAKGVVKIYNSANMITSLGLVRGDGSIGLGSEGEIAVTHAFPHTGYYVMRVRASGDQAGPEPVKIAIRVDGEDLKRFDVTAASGKFQEFQIKQEVRGGPRGSASRS